MANSRTDAHRKIEWDCHQLLSHVFVELDAGRIEAAADLFTDDGEWIRATKTDHGREAIVATSRAMSATRVVQHVLGSVAVTVGDDLCTAAATAQIVAYLHDAGRALEGPAPLERPHSVLTFSVRFLRTADGWRIAQLASRTIFRAKQ